MQNQTWTTLLAWIFRVVKRTRVTAGYLVKMVPVADTLRSNLCEVLRPYNVQRDHTTYIDTRKNKGHLCHKQCIADDQHSEKTERLNPRHEEGATFRRRWYLQWKQTRDRRVPVASAGGSVDLCRYQIPMSTYLWAFIHKQGTFASDMASNLLNTSSPQANIAGRNTEVFWVLTLVLIEEYIHWENQCSNIHINWLIIYVANLILRELLWNHILMLNNSFNLLN